jgi:hypothetical protein
MDSWLLLLKLYLKNVQNKGLQLNRLECVCNDFRTVHGRDADIYRDMYIFRNDKFTFAADNDSQRTKEKKSITNNHICV